MNIKTAEELRAAIVAFAEPTHPDMPRLTRRLDKLLPYLLFPAEVTLSSDKQIGEDVQVRMTWSSGAVFVYCDGARAAAKGWSEDGNLHCRSHAQGIRDIIQLHINLHVEAAPQAILPTMEPAAAAIRLARAKAAVSHAYHYVDQALDVLHKTAAELGVDLKNGE